MLFRSVILFFEKDLKRNQVILLMNLLKVCFSKFLSNLLPFFFSQKFNFLFLFLYSRKTPSKQVNIYYSGEKESAFIERRPKKYVQQACQPTRPFSQKIEKLTVVNCELILISFCPKGESQPVFGQFGDSSMADRREGLC